MRRHRRTAKDFAIALLASADGCAATMGNGCRSKCVHRLQRVRDRVSGGEQHPDRRQITGGARTDDALAADRSLLREREKVRRG